MSKAVLEEKSEAAKQSLEEFAAQSPETVQGVLAHLALGYQAFQEKRYAEARTHFAAARQPQTPLRDYAEYYLARSEGEEGNHAEAAELLAGFGDKYPSSPLAGQAAVRWAESLLELGKPSGIIHLFSLSPVWLPQPEGDLLLAQAYQKDRQVDKAAVVYQRIHYRFPTSDEASTALKQLQALKKQMGRAFPEPSQEMKEERAAKLFAAGWWVSARREYQALAAQSSGSARNRWRLRVGVSQYRGRATWPALATLKDLKLAEPEAQAERLYTLAALYRRLGREDSILAQIDALAQDHPRSLWYESALFLAGNYYLLVPDPDRADEFYRKVYQNFPKGQYAAQSHWKVAWRSYRERRLPEAKNLFEEHIRMFPDTPQAAASLYWLGHMAEPQNTARAAAYFQKTVETFPNYYYGQMAAQRLSALPPGARTPDEALLRSLAGVARRPADSSSQSFSPAAQQKRDRARLLESAWLMDWAIDEMRGALREEPSARALGAELARLERERGRHHVALRYAKRYLGGYLTYDLADLPREEWELLFPLPWWEELKKTAGDAALDPYVVAGLIRQESEFNPAARSRANARGLMQLLPSTARRMARQVADRRARQYRLSSLYQPEYNLIYGTGHLKKVLEMFAGRLELALAAYNAGENRVTQWLKEGNFEEPSEFIESIPFTETREYVQAVIRNASLYRRLYQDSD